MEKCQEETEQDHWVKAQEQVEEWEVADEAEWAEIALVPVHQAIVFVPSVKREFRTA